MTDNRISASTTLNDYLHARASAHGTPLSGNFELTPCCNLHCRMCYVRREYSEVADRMIGGKQWIDWGREATEKGMLYLLLTGGEPLTHPDFREIYTELHKLGLMIMLNTNGTLIDEDMVNFFAEKVPARVNLTLYGSSPETYERLCGDGSAYERAVKAICALNDRGIQVKLNFSATPSNCDDFPEIMEFAAKRHIRVQTSAYMFPGIRRDREFENGDRFPPREAGALLAQHDLLRFPREEFLARAEDMQNGRTLPDIQECFDQPTEHLRCRAGRSSFWITWDGLLAPCGMMTRPTANVREIGLAQAWEEIRAKTAEILVPSQCTQCSIRSYCVSCPAACLAETGEFTAVPTYLCEMTQAYLENVRAKAEELREENCEN